MSIKVIRVWALFTDKYKRLRKEPDQDVRRGPAVWIGKTRVCREPYFQFCVYPRKVDAKNSGNESLIKKMVLLSEEDFNELVSLKEKKK